MWLRSDNVAGVSPEILDALARAGEGEAAPYGEDALTLALQARFTDLFEHDCFVAPVSSGIAANALALSLLAGPLDAAVAHADAHVVTSEGGAFEMFSQGGRLITLSGRDGRLIAPELEHMLARTDFGRPATVPPRAVTLTQPTERGTLYTLEAVGDVAAVARRHGLKVHMDGARLANAIVALGCRPADLTWRAGVDVLSFGATKNGTMMADAIVVFDPALAATLPQRRRRSGQSMSKMRFMAAQLHAYLEHGLWLRNAAQANRSARRLADALRRLKGIEIVYPVETNMIFARIAPHARRRLEEGGVRFRQARASSDGAEALARLVAAFNTDEAAVDRLVELCRKALA